MDCTIYIYMSTVADAGIMFRGPNYTLSKLMTMCNEIVPKLPYQIHFYKHKETNKFIISVKKLSANIKIAMSKSCGGHSIRNKDKNLKGPIVYTSMDQ